MSADRDASNSTKVTNKTLNVLLIREYGEMDQQVEKLFDRDVWKISYAQDNKTALELATARAFDRLQPYQNTREIWCRRRESNDTRLLILRNLLQTYERKNRTTRCMAPSAVQNHVQRNRALRRCSSSQVLTKITVLACLLLRRFYPLCPWPVLNSVESACNHFLPANGNSLGAFIRGSSLSRR